jgi:cyclic pyranopterin monophosphate synthase
MKKKRNALLSRRPLAPAKIVRAAMHAPVQPANGVVKPNGFSHLDKHGNARMMTVTNKPDMMRLAIAAGEIQLAPNTIRSLQHSALPKGDVLTVAKIAAVQAAKRTSDLIPLCHPLPLHRIEVRFQIAPTSVQITAEVETVGKTGVEMEALTAVATAALTIYDMCRSVDAAMSIGPIKLLEKAKGS